MRSRVVHGPLMCWTMCLLSAMGTLAAHGASAADDVSAAGSIDFQRDIRPILSENCFHCHGPDTKHREAELRLDTRDGLFRTKDGVTPVVAGKPDGSALVRRIFSDDEDERMPPPESKRRLTAKQKSLLRRWVQSGAHYSRHWSFEPPQRPVLPTINNAADRLAPIDTFVQSRLKKEGLSPAPEASRTTLIRRLSLDLTGLPPTPEEVDAFLRDESPQAYETLVDRLLASPHFGERMAIPWLDAARYADTNGFSIDDHRDMWLWREWVIDALNRNMPYNQFVLQQLAGDLLPGATGQHRLATGFLRNSMNTHEGGILPSEYRVIYIADKVNTVSTVFMGLTMRCAQCHDHKFDPISQQDYYRFYAFFDTAHERGMGTINGNTAPILRIDGPLTKAATFRRDVEQRIATLRRYQLHPPELIQPRAAWEAQAIASAKGDLAEAIKTPEDQRSDKHWETINAAFAKTTRLWGRHTSTIDREIAVLQSDLKAGKSSVMVMKEQGPRQTYLLTRGQYDQPDKNQPVTAGVPAVLSPLGAKRPAAPPPATGASSSRPQVVASKGPTRLDLARWLTRGDHPLTARVAVNRFWQILFGRGLVSTPSDFGSQGAFPTHPLLLDWLALEYSQNGWDTKRLIKTILMSATYRQSSSATRSLIERDPLNELLARAARYRLSAELIRDGALAISGTLGKRIGGPSVYPSQPHGLWREVSHFGYPKAFTAQAFYPSDDSGQSRRSMYTFWKRTSPPPSMIAFDAPSREMCTLLRSRTNTPLQALVLLNDPEYVGAARALAGLAMREGGATVENRIDFIFRRATARRSDAAERKILRARYDRALRKYQQDTDAAEALVRDSTAEHAAWTIVASIVLNLDEVITRE